MVSALVVALAFQPAPAMLRALFEKALAQSVSEYGEADARTAQAARDLGLFLIRQGDLPAARAALAQAVRAGEKALGARRGRAANACRSRGVGLHLRAHRG